MTMLQPGSLFWDRERLYLVETKCFIRGAPAVEVLILWHQGGSLSRVHQVDWEEDWCSRDFLVSRAEEWTRP